MAIFTQYRQIILATGNQHKAQEIASIYCDFKVVNYTDFIPAMDIQETGNTFSDNASIKAQAVFNALNDNNALVLADDSGLCVKALDNAPGVYSARFAGANASDIENNQKLIKLLKQKQSNCSKAFFVCALALANKTGIKVVHGFCHGQVGTELKGQNGFGYDALFTPKHHKQSLAEMPTDLKNQISHRTHALKLMRYLL